VHTKYQYALEIRTEDEDVVGSRIFEPNWDRAVESARFEWFRKSREIESGADRDVVIEPLPDPQEGLPATDGFQVLAVGSGDAEVPEPVAFPVAYFNRDAAAISTAMVGEGLLTEGRKYRYTAFAFPQSEPAPAPKFQNLGFTIDEVVDRMPTPKPVSLPEFGAESRREGEVLGEQFPVFLPQRILDEADELTEQAGGIETGGILIGHLVRDAGIPELALNITAQIPARKAEGGAHKLTFTADTWTDVRGVIDLRRGDEQMLGWWHSHPAKAWCNPECPPEQRRNCPLANNFFSADDVLLHQTIFARAYQTALVVTHTETGMKHSMFGWFQGAVRQRDFFVTSPSRSPVGIGAPSSI
jgi:hypothetical protein